MLSAWLGVSHARAGILRCAQPDHLMGASSKAAEVRWSNSLHALWRKIARETYGIQRVRHVLHVLARHVYTNRIIDNNTPSDPSRGAGGSRPNNYASLTVTQRYDVRFTGFGLNIPKLRCRDRPRPRGDRLFAIAIAYSRESQSAPSVLCDGLESRDRLDEPCVGRSRASARRRARKPRAGLPSRSGRRGSRDAHTRDLTPWPPTPRSYDATTPGREYNFTQLHSRL